MQGFPVSDIRLFMGRPKSGKTRAFVEAIIEHLEEDRRVLLVSSEHKPEYFREMLRGNYDIVIAQTQSRDDVITQISEFSPDVIAVDRAYWFGEGSSYRDKVWSSMKWLDYLGQTYVNHVITTLQSVRG